MQLVFKLSFSAVYAHTIFNFSVHILLPLLSIISQTILISPTVHNSRKITECHFTVCTSTCRIIPVNLSRAVDITTYLTVQFSQSPIWPRRSGIMNKLHMTSWRSSIRCWWTMPLEQSSYACLLIDLCLDTFCHKLKMYLTVRGTSAQWPLLLGAVYKFSYLLTCGHTPVSGSLDETVNVLFSGQDKARWAVGLEFRITFLQERQQLLHHAADVVAVDERKTQLHCTSTPPHHHNRFTALFPGVPGWAGARRELLDFMMQGRLTKADILTIRTNQCLPPPSPHIFYRPDALPDAQPPASKHWRQLAHSDYGEDTRVLLNSVTCTVSVP